MVEDSSCAIVTEKQTLGDKNPGFIPDRFREFFHLQNTQTGWGPTQRTV